MKNQIVKKFTTVPGLNNLKLYHNLDYVLEMFLYTHIFHLSPNNKQFCFNNS